jgi:hypothetical protein
MSDDIQYRTFVKTHYPNYNGVIDPAANNIGLANGAPTIGKIGQAIDYSTDPLALNFWQGFGKEGGFISDSANQAGGMNAMSVMHDGWGQNFIVGKAPFLQISIFPAIAIQYCATFPAVCGTTSGQLINNNNFGVKK